MANSCHVILVHFEEIASPERQPKPSAAVIGRAKKIITYLKDRKHMEFLFFMVDVLDSLKELSLKFQQDRLTALDAMNALETCLLQLVNFKTQPGPMLSEFEVPEYKGIKFTKHSNLGETEKTDVIGEYSMYTVIIP